MDSANVDLKKTVNLPRTDFAMKANLPQTEPKLIERWEQEDLYGKIRQARAGRPTYILHDGPPYANGRIHLGTAFNKMLKDFIVKSKNMAGFDAPYVPGWDCHGLPIEIRVDSELGSRKAADVRQGDPHAPAASYAEKYVDLQRHDFKRLGVLGRWDEPYLTMSARYQAVIAGAFVDFLDKGYVYKGLKPVHWCIRTARRWPKPRWSTQNHSSPSIWVRFALISDPAAVDAALAGRKVYGLIWTTTPWTIPANMAIAFHPKFEYVAVEVAGRRLHRRRRTAAGHRREVPAGRNTPCWPVSRAWSWSTLRFRHPFLERDSLGILADHVTLEQGTGAVHTAPGHGQEDYVVGAAVRDRNLLPGGCGGPLLSRRGRGGRAAGRTDRQDGLGGQPVVVEMLRARGALLQAENVEH